MTVSEGVRESVDSITVEVISNAIVSIVREMRAGVTRSAFNQIIYEMHDFSCAVTNSQGDILGIADDLPAHVFPSSVAVQAVTDRYGSDIKAGDVFMINDSYVLGSHLNDTATLVPFFFDDTLEFWIVIRVHYLDIGGMSPGSITSQATDVHQEGIRIPPIRMQRAGVEESSGLELLIANVRQSHDFEGDMLAVMGAARIASARLQHLFEKYSAEVVHESTRIAMDRSERRMKDAIRRLPKRQAYAEQYIEHPRTGAPVLVSALVKVLGDALVVDFTGSAPQMFGCVNGGQASGPSGAFIAVKACLDPMSPVNGGAFRPISVLTLPETVVHATYPTACGGAMNVINHATEVTMKAMASLIPSAVVADYIPYYAGNWLYGWDPLWGRRYIHWPMVIGGTGAVKEHDGNNVVAGYERGDFGRVPPAEVVETSYPIRVERSELATDTAGPGTTRGGLGIRRHERLLAPSATLSCQLEPSLLPPGGFFGGGSSSQVMAARIIRGDQVLTPGPVPGKAPAASIQEGDVVEYLSSSGGGYGDPLDRDPQLVLEDVIAGYVSAQGARRDYGVVIRSQKVLTTATSRLRDRMRSSRVLIPVFAIETDVFEHGRRIFRLSASAAGRVRAVDDDLLEMVSAHAPTLRGWVRISSADEGIPLGPMARLALQVRQGDQVWLRRPLFRIPRQGSRRLPPSARAGPQRHVSLSQKAPR